MEETTYKKIFSKNLRFYMAKNNKSQIDLINDLHLNKSAVSTWVNGTRLPRMDKVDLLAKYFNIASLNLLEDRTAENNISTTKSYQIPVLSRVAAGIPINAITEIIDTEEISEDMAKNGKYFGLKIKGDSMEPRIYNGDVVIVRQQDDAESGDIVIAMVNGDDATCKRLVKYASSIALVSLNSKYEPMMFTNQEVIEKPVRVIGKVMELRGKF